MFFAHYIGGLYSLKRFSSRVELGLSAALRRTSWLIVGCKSCVTSTVEIAVIRTSTKSQGWFHLTMKMVFYLPYPNKTLNIGVAAQRTFINVVFGEVV